VGCVTLSELLATVFGVLVCKVGTRPLTGQQLVGVFCWCLLALVPPPNFERSDRNPVKSDLCAAVPYTLKAKAALSSQT
jgi:hypothetical protein